MNRRTEFVETLLFLAFCLVLVFLFKGNPSLWDLLHAKAMEACR